MIDLHCHSTISDGALSPAEVVRLAHANGCTMLALTDHDHTGGLAAARVEADALGLKLINGVEVSVTWRQRTIHIVGLDFDDADARLQNLLARKFVEQILLLKILMKNLMQATIASLS